jgi:hypothetical protein
MSNNEKRNCTRLLLTHGIQLFHDLHLAGSTLSLNLYEYTEYFLFSVH